MAAALMVVSTPAIAQTAAPETTVSLNGTWQFAFAPDLAEADRLAGFYLPAYDTKQFVPIRVPSNWAMQGFEPPHYKPFREEASQGFYIHRFQVPATWQDRRVLLHFGGVWSSAEVWLNGKPLGRHDSGYTSFAYDATAALNPGGENVLAVRVRQTTHDFRFDTNDDWAMGGIYRDVSLEAMPNKRWIDRVDAQTTFDDQFRDADLKVRVMVEDTHTRRDEVRPYELSLTLLGVDGQKVESSKIAIPAHSDTGRDVGVTLHVQSPQHWTAETPALYRLRVDLLEGGEVAHTRTLQVGFRQISTANGIFRINGQAIKLRGVDRHDEYPDVGRATTPANWLQDLTLMKAANINFIRTSHYPPAAGFLDLCDQMGMYVDDEVPMGYGGDLANDPAYTSAVMLRSYEAVSRDINHPSVILWSIGNENRLTTLHMASIRTVKGLDPTRPVLMPWRAEDWLPPEIDILAPHYNSAAQYDALAGRATRPVVTTEYTHAYGTDGFGGLEERWKALTKHPAGTGGAIWMWADQGLQVTEQKPGGGKVSTLLLNPDGIDGIVGSFREPQRDYWETKAVYAQTYPALDRAAFVPGQPSVRIPIQNDFDFTNLSAVKISWKLMEDDRELDHDAVTIAAQPHAQGWLDLRLNKIGEIRRGATYYAWLTFVRADGSEITRRSVELEPHASDEFPPARKAGVLSVRTGKEVVVQAGDTTFSFDPKTAQLSSVMSKEKLILSGTQFTIWRPMNSTEQIIVNAEGGEKDLPDLNRFRTVVREWHVSQTVDEVRIETVADHIVDPKNHFTVTYRYSIHTDGTLAIHYSVLPQVQATWLPFVGLTIQTVPELTHLRWLGLGPLDAYPNESAAPILGVWSGTLGSGDATGMKATRWAELTEASGRGFSIQGAPYIRVDGPSGIQALSSVAGRPSKRVRAEDPEQRLDTGKGASFEGQFSLSLVDKAVAVHP